MSGSLKQKPWWGYLEHDLRELLEEAFLLSVKARTWKEKFHDYSFVVFPAAKAYEGFLKKIFLDLGLITKESYFGKRFRIGKALNPELDRKRYKEQSIYDKLSVYCGGQELPDFLWETWKKCRNLIFHWFPKEAKAISHEEATARLSMIVDAIDKVYKICKI